MPSPPSQPSKNPLYAVDSGSSEFQRLLNETWYYTLELKPGVFTRGAEYPSAALNRELLRRATLLGRDACDIGTMEGLIPILLKRRGARSVVAMDAVDLTERVRLVQECYGQRFEYYPRISLSRAKDFLSERANLSHYWGQARVERGFDVVVLTGVLYHVFSPLHLLGLVRTLLREGGLLILETAASCEDRYAQNWVFDGKGWIYPGGTDTWFVTLKLLDYFLRYLKLKPIDCVHLPANQENSVTRVAIAATAVTEVLPLEAESQFFVTSTNNIDYNEVVDIGWARGGPVEIPYSPGDNVWHSNTVSVDLHNTVKERPSLPYDRDKIVLHLSDQG